MIENKHKNIFLTSLFLLELARTLPHAVLTIILINKNVSLGQIALIQVFYMLAIIVLEFPSGIISDIFGRKRTYLLSVILFFISYTYIYFANSFWHLAICWFIYGAASAMESGTLDITFTNIYKNDTYKLKRFISHMTITISTAAILGGFCGGVAYNFIDINIYIISSILFLFSFIVVSFFFPKEKQLINSDNKINNKIKFKEFFTRLFNVLKRRDIIELVLLISTVQFFYQPFYQYWQIVLSDRGFLTSYFSLIYALFRFSNIISSIIFNRINYNRKNSIVLLLISLFFGLISGITNSNVLFFLSLVITLITINIYALNLDAYLRENIDSDTASSMIGISGTITRVFSVLVLLLCSALVYLMSALNTIIICITIFVVTSIILICRFNFKYK